MSNLLFELRYSRTIGEQCFQKLHRDLNNYTIEEVLTPLYSVLLYAKLAEAHAQSSNNPLFQFTSSEEYSNRLIQLNTYQLHAEAKKLESSFQSKQLASLLLNFRLREGIDQATIARTTELAARLEQSTPLSAQVQSEFKRELTGYLQSMPPTLSRFEQLYLQGLLREVLSTRPDQLIPKLYSILATEEHLKRSIRSVRALNQTLQTSSAEDLRNSIAKCKRAYNGSVYLLRDFKNLPSLSPIRFYQLVGQMKTEWQKTNEIITRATGQLAHRLCSCQAALPPIQQRLAEWPFHSNSLINLTPEQINAIHDPVSPVNVAAAIRNANHQKAVAVIGCDWGGGHLAATSSIVGNLAKLGYHSHTIDLPKVLVSEDPVRNNCLTRWLGKEWDVSWLFNNLLKEKAYACINFLRGRSNGAPDPKVHQKKLTLTLNQLLTSAPDMVITTYSADNEVIFDACELLGIPCLHYTTDIDTSVETRTTPRESRHMKMAIAFNDPSMLARVGTTARPDQIVIGGPLVSHEFTTPRTRNDAVRLKQEWRIDANKKVVVISSGKNGGYSKYPEMLAKRYAQTNPQDIPIHLVVLCGANNEKFLNKLQRDVLPTTNLPISLFTSVPEEKMEELLTMAAHGGCLSGKSGGGTLFRAITRGTRLLIDNVKPGFSFQGATSTLIAIFEWILRMLGHKSQLPWEEINMTFAKANHFADSFNREEEFLGKLDQILAHDAPAQMPFEVKNCETALEQTVASMIAAAENDIAIARIRRELRGI